MNYHIKPLRLDLDKYLVKHFLEKKWEKIKKFLENDLRHSSLDFKKIVFKHTVVYSFRLDKQYRGICVLKSNIIEIILFTNHYN